MDCRTIFAFVPPASTCSDSMAILLHFPGFPVICRLGARHCVQQWSLGFALNAAVLVCSSGGVLEDSVCFAIGQDDELKTESGDAELADKVVDLLAGDFRKDWQVFDSGDASSSGVVWKVVQEPSDAEPVLSCSGEPKGFVFTSEKYSDFELTLEWKFPTDADGNSGILVYVQDEPRIWPTSIQVQLHQPKAGSIFPSGDATSDNTSDAEPDHLARPVNTWNECRIVSRGGRLGVEINGKKAGEISGARPCGGSIALQCEGSEVHFRRIRLRKLRVQSPETSIDSELIPANAEPAQPLPSPSKAQARRYQRDIRHSRLHLKSIPREQGWQVTRFSTAEQSPECPSCYSADMPSAGRETRRDNCSEAVIIPSG